MKILFKKTYSYQSSPAHGDAFEYVSKLALQKNNPLPHKQNSVLFKQKKVFHSPLRRVEKSLAETTESHYIRDEKLKEVIFDIKKMCTREEYEESKSKIIRRKFKEFFIKDQLPQKRKELFSEIEAVLKKIRKTHENEVVVLSHSFKLKLFEAYIKTNGEIKKKPELIHKFIHDNKKTFEFGKGFTIEI